MTGPSPRKTWSSSSSKLTRRRSTISGSAPASISRRTASPLRRLCSSDADGFEQRARLFFFEVEVGVAGDAEGCAGEHLVAAIHAGEVLRDQVLEQEVVECAVFGGQADEAGQSAGHRDDAEHLRAGAACACARSSRARQSALLSTRGKGCAGSMAMGVSSGSTSRWK